jgi:hypothetical protein
LSFQLGGCFAREVIGRGTIFRASRPVEHDIKGANKEEDEEGEVEEKNKKNYRSEFRCIY